MKEMGKKEVESLSRLCQFILLFRVDLLELEDKIFACRRENAADSHLSSEDLVSKYVQDLVSKFGVHQKISDTKFSRRMKQAQNSNSETPMKKQRRTSRTS